MRQAFAGIDVAFAKGKRLPVVVCVREGVRLVPLLLRDFREALPPRGRGNRIALDPEAVRTFALEALEYLRAVEKAYGLRLKRIAIDAPSCYKRDGIARRAAEVAMDERRISCFATPSQIEFEKIFEVWIPGAEIAFQPLPGNNHFPVIDDPKPPGPENEPSRFGPGKFGDIEVHEGEQPTDEMQYARSSCDWKWRQSGIKSNALVVIIARNLVARSGVAPSVGVHPGHLSLRNRNDGRDLCEVPRKLTQEDIRDGYAIIVDPEILAGRSREGPQRGGQGDPAIILAHELGHALLLAHGDGFDNDGNGTQPPGNGFRRFDEDCDPAEVQQVTSIMSSGGYDKKLTPLQLELARTAAVLAPDAKGGPP